CSTVRALPASVGNAARILSLSVASLTSSTVPSRTYSSSVFSMRWSVGLLNRPRVSIRGCSGERLTHGGAVTRCGRLRRSTLSYPELHPRSLHQTYAHGPPESPRFPVGQPDR